MAILRTHECAQEASRVTRETCNGLIAGISIKTSGDCGSAGSDRSAIMLINRLAWLMAAPQRLREDPWQLAAVIFSRRLRGVLTRRCSAPRLDRVELIHRLTAQSNLNSRDENDGIEKRRGRFD